MNAETLQRLAPHMIVGLAGTVLSDGEREILRGYPVAGVILFERNVAGARGLMELTQEIRRIFRDERATAPIVAADHEGGIISVLARAIGTPPTQAAAGRIADVSLCDRLFAENARRMRSCGVNMLLGPVADLDSDPDNPVIGTRSFGADPDLVSRLTATAVSAARREGVLTCVKHFPGHGPTSVDSHLALPTLSADLDELRGRDVRPFARGIAAGAESVMIGHIAPRGRALPASLDPGVIKEVLRGELGFDGVVMTDAIEMEGIRRVEAAGAAGAAGPAEAAGGAIGEGGRTRSVLDICRIALEAGNDVLLFSKGAVEVFELLGGREQPPGNEPFFDETSTKAAEASRERIRRLIEAAAARERDFELPGDAAAYDEIAERSIEVVSREGPGVFAIGDGVSGSPSTVFCAGKGDLERYPIRSFIERTVRALQAGRAGTRHLPTKEEAAWWARLGLRLPTTPSPAGELEILESPDREGNKYKVVILLNRRPLAAETVQRMCEGAGAVVVAGWPHAARFIARGPLVIITRGIYDAAVDVVCRLLLEPRG